MKKQNQILFTLISSLLLLSSCSGGAGGALKVVDSPSESTGSGEYIFTTYSYQSGYNELWKSDGTTAGTTMLKSIETSDLTKLGNTYYFRGYEGTYGGELWKTDGTVSGTVLVKDLEPGLGSSGISNLVAFKNQIFFSVSNMSGQAMYKTDGTDAGTVLVKSLNVVSNFYVVGNLIYFSVNDPTYGVELWKSDGTTSGTVMVKDINPTGDGYPRNFVALNSTIYFSADDGTHGYELWKSDGTASGTVMVKDINLGSDDSNLEELTVYNNALYFRGYTTANGYELWKSDGTDAGTVLLKEFVAGAGHGYPYNFVISNNKLYFHASSNASVDLWETNGTSSGTVKVTAVQNGHHGVVVYKDEIYYFKDNELWKLNKVTGAAQKIATMDQPFPVRMVVSEGMIYYRVGSGDGSFYDLWKSDGTPAGTIKVKANMDPEPVS